MTDNDVVVKSGSPEFPDGDNQKPPGKVWTAGTLTYTSAGLAALFFWLLFGDFAWSMRDRSVGPMAQWFLSSQNVPNIVFALLVSSLPAVVGVILGPIISYKSDRHRGKRGRRIPFLLVSTPVAALGMIGLGLTPVFARALHGICGVAHPFGAWLHQTLGTQAAGASLLAAMQNEMIVAVVCFGIFWTAFEIATTVAQSVFGGLINDVVPKPLIGRFFGLFRAVSLIDGMIFNFWIMGMVPTHFTLILVIVGVTYGAAFLWMCFKVREGQYPDLPPEPEGQKPLAAALGGVRVYLRESFSNPYYLSVFVMIATAALVFLPVNTFAIPYARSLGVDMNVYGKFLALTYLISLCLAYFLGWLADAFHPLRVAMASLAGYVLVAAWGAIYAKTPDTFLTAWVMHGVLAGCYTTSAASLGQRLFPHSRYAQFASAAGLVGAVAHSSLAPVMGLIIDQSGNVYRHTFLVGCLLGVVALVAAGLVYGKFRQYGGPSSYIAPL